ncbi:unnamed protein product [Prunus armeniaca]|uniref:Uncharacterized protein n=1 Tax=Prunus armeniaca TaxID=36596 RepID=A0A6J5UCJ6_PRUAR|nr:unnamed protein product [Prunus armeniaca]
MGVPSEVDTSLGKISKWGVFEFVPHNQHGALMVCLRSFWERLPIGRGQQLYRVMNRSWKPIHT